MPAHRHPRSAEVFDLREAGLTYQAIADRLGISGRGAARNIYEQERTRRAGLRIEWRTRETTSRRIARTLDGAQRIYRATEVAANEAVTRATRTFGVEIEFNGCTANAALTALQAAGIEAHAENYNHQVRPHWKLVYDGSVSGTGTGNYNGHELVSPILRGSEGLAELKTVLAALRSAGAQVDASCGTHVHFGVQDLGGAGVATLLETWHALRTTSFSLLAASRRESGTRHRWCRSHADHEVTSLAHELRTVNRVGFVDRYRSLNLARYGAWKTIEIRSHQGTLNYTKLSGWIEYVLSIIEAVKNGAHELLQRSANVIDALVQHGGLDEAIARKLHARREAYGFAPLPIEAPFVVEHELEYALAQ